MTATLLTGVPLLLLGLFRLGAVVRYSPLPIVIGFTNGVAVLISVSQRRGPFGSQVPGKLPADFCTVLQALGAHLGTVNPVGADTRRRVHGRAHRLAPRVQARRSAETAKQRLIPTITFALLGADESLLCARVADNLPAAAHPDMARHDPNQALMAVVRVAAPLATHVPLAVLG